MEDLAPVQPARRDARIWCAACGVAFLLFGLLPLMGLLPGALGAALPWLVTGAIALVAGVARVAYRQRAVAMVVLGLLTGLVALHGSSTLVRADGGPGWGMARLFSVVALTAALLFRARYRALRRRPRLPRDGAGDQHPVRRSTSPSCSRARPASGRRTWARSSSCSPSRPRCSGSWARRPRAQGRIWRRSWSPRSPSSWRSRGLAVVGIVGRRLAAAGGAGGRVRLRRARPGSRRSALFQILAWQFAADARRIDLHSPWKEKPPPSEHDPSSEWSSRG